MDKLALSLCLLLFASLSLVGYYFLSDNGYYKTEKYYIYNTQTSAIKYQKTNNGERIKYYEYKLPAYKEGKRRDLTLHLLTPIKKNHAYLVEWEDRRSIVSDIKEIDQSKFIDNKK